MPTADRIGGRDEDQLYRVYRGLDPFPVESTNVESLAWDDAQGLLFVKFKNGGRVYCYDVPATIFTGLATAASKGKFIYDKIRGADGQRPARLLDLDHRFKCVRIE